MKGRLKLAEKREVATVILCFDAVRRIWASPPIQCVFSGQIAGSGSADVSPAGGTIRRNAWRAGGTPALPGRRSWLALFGFWIGEAESMFLDFRAGGAF